MGKMAWDSGATHIHLTGRVWWDTLFSDKPREQPQFARPPRPAKQDIQEAWLWWACMRTVKGEAAQDVYSGGM